MIDFSTVRPSELITHPPIDLSILTARRIQSLPITQVEMLVAVALVGFADRFDPDGLAVSGLAPSLSLISGTTDLTVFETLMAVRSLTRRGVLVRQRAFTGRDQRFELDLRRSR